MTGHPGGRGTALHTRSILPFTPVHVDFFGRQEQARKQTFRLLVYFALAILGISLAVYAAVKLGAQIAGQADDTSPFRAAAHSPWLDWNLFGLSTVSTLLVVLFASGFKSLQLLQGGKVVAEQLGGRRIDRVSLNPEERRLLNVVEEMAIASGVPVPEVYLLEDEHNINAFAAGRGPSDAAIGVTRGCLKWLTRDELQGVVAHEFSHLLNGDMRLNLRLMALIFGITFLTVVGRILLRLSGESREKGALPFALFGLALIVIGFLGSLCGRLIQSAVSRQREFLADASAVQFTRNPDGIAGALKKIGAQGSGLLTPHAEEAEHMMIASALSSGRPSLFATHPPLRDRIRAIDPDWRGAFEDVHFPQPSTFVGASSLASPSAPLSTETDAPVSAPALAQSRSPEAFAIAVLEPLGQLHAEHLKRSEAILRELPSEGHQAASDPRGAQAVVFALLLHPENSPEGASNAPCLAQNVDSPLYEKSLQLHRVFQPLASTHKIALVDLAIPTLRRLSSDDYRHFVSVTESLAWSDEKIDLFEFTLRRIVKRHLDLYFHQAPPPKVRYRKLRQLREELAVLLSALAHCGTEDPQERQEAFRTGFDDFVAELSGASVAYRESVSRNEVEQALERFDAAAPMIKRQLLFAATRTVGHDDALTNHEAELIRAIADTIGVPIPQLAAL